MLQRLSNNAGIDLAAAVWLATDEYQYDDRPNAISVTSLIKPLRQVILGSRVPVEERTADVLELWNSSLGHALHGAVERSWKLHYATSLKKLGVPQRVIDCVRINPEMPEPDTLPVYTEHRVERDIDGWIVSGQVDLIIEGRLRDVKSTKVWGYLTQKGVEQWKLQGSIYRWLNPGKITHDELLVQYLLLDWTRAAKFRDPNYPPHALPTRLIPLLSVAETEAFLRTRLALITQYKGAPESQLPECTDDELWRSDPIYKYYSNPDAPPGTRSQKNFDNLQDALRHKSEKGKGRIDTRPGLVKACLYCAGFSLCTQKDRLIAAGELELDSP